MVGVAFASKSITRIDATVFCSFTCTAYNIISALILVELLQPFLVLLLVDLSIDELGF